MSQIRTIRVFQGGVIGGSSARIIDLSLITAADIIAANNYLELIPYLAGRFIKEVWFEADGYYPATGFSKDITLFTPNTNPLSSGYANVFAQDDPRDTDTIIEDGSGVILYRQGPPNSGSLQSGPGMISDCGPLYATIKFDADGGGLGERFTPFLAWSPNTVYAKSDTVTGSNDHLYFATTGGTSGTGTSPADDDGTVTWSDQGAFTDFSDGAIRAKALVYDSPDSPCTYPAALEFLQQPTDAVAEATITPVITVRLKDQNGDPYNKYTTDIMVQIYGTGTLVGTAANGIFPTSTGFATFNDLSITEPGTYRLIARWTEGPNVPRVLSDPFEIT